MAKFYGQVLSLNKSPATRTGHSGISVSAQSWHGSIQVSLTPVNENDESEDVWVSITVGEGSTGHGDILIWSGPISEFLQEDKLTYLW